MLNYLCTPIASMHVWSYICQFSVTSHCRHIYSTVWYSITLHSQCSFALCYEKKKLKLKKQWQIFLRNFLVSKLCENEMILETYPPGYRTQMTSWTSSERLMYFQLISFSQGISFLFFFI